MKQWITFAATVAVASAASLWTAIPASLAADGVATSAEVSELRANQEALRRDLDDIKKKLTALTTPPAAPKAVEKIDAVVSVGDIKGKGRANAPLTLIEFSDYQCPFCGRHASQTLPQLVKDYVDSGKLRYVFRDFPLEFHPNALKAAEAARCAGDQDKYWEMHDKLFANQNALQPAKLTEYAKAIGINDGQFDQCLSSGKYAQAIAKDMQQANVLGIRGTPTLVLGHTDGDKVKDAVIIRGAHPLATFSAEIDKMLAAPVAKAN
jgi:protein-disulfide isomerase